MNFNLPSSDDLKHVEKSNRKIGRLKTFINQIQAQWLSILIILIYLFLINPKNEKRLSNIETNLNISNQTNQNVTISQKDNNQGNVTIK